jgi:hypothetical protein
MARCYLFADESGNLDFSRSRGATPYFAVGTMLVRGDDAVEALRTDLLKLQTELGWSGIDQFNGFHASEDAQAVRDEVLEVLRRHPVTLDVTLLEKSKTQPHLRATDVEFFRLAWARHLSTLPSVAGAADELMVAVAAVGTRKTRAAFRAAAHSAVTETALHDNPRIVFTPAAADPALQAADYLLWAAVRDRVQGDGRALAVVQDRVRSLVDVFAHSDRHYY